jgi:hypothetical protein
MPLARRSRSLSACVAMAECESDNNLGCPHTVVSQNSLENPGTASLKRRMAVKSVVNSSSLKKLD